MSIIEWNGVWALINSENSAYHFDFISIIFKIFGNIVTLSHKFLISIRKIGVEPDCGSKNDEQHCKVGENVKNNQKSAKIRRG